MLLRGESELKLPTLSSLFSSLGNEPCAVLWNLLSLTWSSMCGLLPQTHCWFREGKNCLLSHPPRQLRAGSGVRRCCGLIGPGQTEEVMPVKWRRWNQENVQPLSFFPKDIMATDILKSVDKGTMVERVSSERQGTQESRYQRKPGVNWWEGMGESCIEKPEGGGETILSGPSFYRWNALLVGME